MTNEEKRMNEKERLLQLVQEAKKLVPNLDFKENTESTYVSYPGPRILLTSYDILVDGVKIHSNNSYYISAKDEEQGILEKTTADFLENYMKTLK